MFLLLTIGNQSHGQAADDLQDANGAPVPLRGDLHSEEGGERKYFGILDVLCALQSRGKEIEYDFAAARGYN